MKPKTNVFYNGWMALAIFGLTVIGCSTDSSVPNPTVPESRTRSTSERQVEKAKLPTLIKVSISPEARVKATAEEIPMELIQGSWQEYLIQVENGAGITAPLVIESHQFMMEPNDSGRDRWLVCEIDPVGPLTGERMEVRTLRLKGRDAGIRTAVLNFNAGQGTQDLGFRSDVILTFKVKAK